MMTGVVTGDGIAVMWLKFKSANGLEVDLQAMIDTGFSPYVSLPQSWVTAMALPYMRLEDVTLADGSTVAVDVYEGVVIWNGQEKLVEAHCMEGDPLVGMALLRDFLLTLPVRIGETFTVALMP